LWFAYRTPGQEGAYAALAITGSRRAMSRGSSGPVKILPEHAAYSDVSLLGDNVLRRRWTQNYSCSFPAHPQFRERCTWRLTERVGRIQTG
jgi:hypothetical protein